MAKLHKISIEEVDSYVDQCHKKYGNLLTSEQQRNYIRAAIEADHPFQYFQFTGRVFQFRWTNLFWVSTIPKWFRKFYTNEGCRIDEHIHTSKISQTGYISFLFSAKRGCHQDDYIVNINPCGIMAVPKEIFEEFHNKNEIQLYEYCRNKWYDAIDRRLYW